MTLHPRPSATSATFTSTRRDEDQPFLDLSAAPLPTPATLRRRRSLWRQAGRFVAFSARIMRMVAAGHH